MGPLTREGECNFHSPLNCAFLIESDIHFNDFAKRYIHLFRFYLGCLTEGWRVNALYRSYPIERIGCDISDVCENTPSEMVNEMISHTVRGDLIARTIDLLHCQSQLTSSNSLLLKDFQKHISEKWGDRIPYNVFMARHLKDFQRRHNQHELTKQGFIRNIELEWIQPLTAFCFDLAFLLNFSDCLNTVAILKKLKGFLPDYFLQRFQETFIHIHTYCWTAAQEKKSYPVDASEPGEITFHNILMSSISLDQRSTLPAFDSKMIGFLETAETTILEPAYAMLNTLVMSRYNNSETFYARPKDAWDLSRCIHFVEDYLKQSGRIDLTDEEKDKVRRCSGSWKGIVDNLGIFRTEIIENKDWHDETVLLRKRMNGGTKIYGENEPKEITAEEKTEIDTFIQQLVSGKVNTRVYDLKGRSRVFANHLIEALQKNTGYFLVYKYGNEGTNKLDQNLNFLEDDRVNETLLLDTIDYNNYNLKEISFTAGIPKHNLLGSEIRLI